MAHFSSPPMASLRAGVILKLLQAVGPSSKNNVLALNENLVPAVLQVTGITPAVAGPDIFSGHQGFYLRLSDLSHSSYFSLPPDHDDLILGDRLHLGQLLQVNSLKPAVPVPILHEFLVLPGRFPCLQDTADLTVPNPNSNCTSTDIKKVIYSSSSPVPIRPLPGVKVKSHIPRSVSAGISKTRLMSSSPDSYILKKGLLERRSSEVLSELRKFRVTCTDDDSGNDSDESSRSRISSCTSSSSNNSSSPHVSTLRTVRKSWDDSESVKGVKPTHSRSRSASLSPNRLTPLRSISKNLSSLEPAASKRKTERTFNVLAAFSSRKICPTPPKGARDGSCTPSHSCAANCVKWPENSVAWASLSPNLSKHGREALRHRDSALQAALDALMEASASEILIRCLSTYAEIQSDKDDDPKDLIDRYLKFQNDLDQAILIAESMARQRQLNKATSKTAAERKQCAFSWIKAALESDLTKYPNQTNFGSMMLPARFDETLSESKIVSPVSCCHKSRLRNNLTEHNTLLVVVELATTLRNESARWFLKYVEKFLDAVEACESHVGGLLCQMKKLDDWLNDIAKRDKSVASVDRSKDSAMLSEEEENEACERVRKKIYGVLLRYVESAAVALESISAADEERVE